MTNENPEPAARGVNEWLTEDLSVRIWRASQEVPIATSRVEHMRAALPPLVLASEVAEWKCAFDDMTDSALSAQRDVKALTAEADTLRARVAELELDVKQWEAEADFQRTRADQAGAEPFPRPQPSAPNAGEALTGIPACDELTRYRATMVEADDMLDHYVMDRDRDHHVIRERVASLAKESRTHFDSLRPAPAPVAADAGLTDEECDALTNAWYRDTGTSPPGFRDDMRRVIAKYLELRPQPARLRMPTVDEARRIRRELSESAYRDPRPALVAFLRTLGAEIVEGGAQISEDAEDALEFYADESHYTKLSDPDDVVPPALTDLGARARDVLRRAQGVSIAPAPDSAPVAEPKSIRTMADEAAKECATWTPEQRDAIERYLRTAASSPAPDYKTMQLAWFGPSAAPAPAREPEPVQDVRRYHASSLINYGGCLAHPVEVVIAADHDRAMAARSSQAARDVQAERVRQQAVEGWTPEHDDDHSDGELAQAAACYCIVSLRDVDDAMLRLSWELWPWDASSFRPSDTRRRELVKAGALILAEIERLDRAAARRRVEGEEARRG